METTYPPGLCKTERCGQSYGLTAGDTFYQGMRGPPIGGRLHDFGLPIDTRRPSECDGWRRMVERARKDIEQWNKEMAVRHRVEQITDSEFDVWFQTITKGQYEHAHNNG